MSLLSSLRMRLVGAALLALALGTPAFAQNPAFLQVIHNSPDPALDSVDVYLNGTLTLDDVPFRGATAFLEVAGDTELLVEVTRKDADEAADAFFRSTLTPVAGQSYHLVAVGVLEPRAFPPNPNGLVTTFALQLLEGARRGAPPASITARVYNGVPDAPSLNVVERVKGRVAVSLRYRTVSEYVISEPDTYLLDISETDRGTLRGSYPLDATTPGQALLLLLSGFLNPTDALPGLELLTIAPDGTVGTVPVEETPRAFVQIIHNSPDPTLSAVDVYINRLRVLDNVRFQRATAFLEQVAGSPLTIGVARSNSVGPADAFYTTTVTLDEGVSYHLIATGVRTPADFAPNPDGADTAFRLIANAPIVAPLSEQGLAAYVYHGSPDAPTVDVLARDAGTVVDDMAFGTAGTGTAGLAFPYGDYVFDVTPGTDNATVVASFEGRLVGGGINTLLATGFLDPEANQNGAPFGFLEVQPTGATRLLPNAATPTALVQVIHNSPDAAADTVDVYIDGLLAVNDLVFRTATGFLPVTAGREIRVAVAPGTSTGVGDALATFPYTLAEDARYQLIATGVLTPATFAPNPEGLPTAFTLLVNDAPPSQPLTEEIQLVVVHGSPDAPTVDLIARNVNTLVQDAPYRAITAPFAVLAGPYTLDVTPGSDNGTLVAAFRTELTASATILASGFLRPGVNQNGPAFSLFSVASDGTVTEFLNVTANEDDGTRPTAFALRGNYPNPFNPATRIAFDLPVDAQVSVVVYDVLGREVLRTAPEVLAAGASRSISVDGAALGSGAYLYRVTATGAAQTFSQTGRMTLVK